MSGQKYGSPCASWGEADHERMEAVSALRVIKNTAHPEPVEGLVLLAAGLTGKDSP